MNGSSLKKQKSPSSDSPGPAWGVGFLLVLFILGLASLTAWKIFEDDIYMQIRAGQEIWHSKSVPTQDAWSFTVKGENWINYNWLSMLLFAGVFDHFQEPGLVVLRVLNVTLWFAAACFLLFRICPQSRRDPGFVLSVAVGVMLLFFLGSSRIQLRPETLGFPLFLCILALWAQPHEGRRRYWITPLIIWLWSNLHGGTAIFGLFLAGVFLFRELLKNFRSPQNRLIWISGLACMAAFFATPIGVQIIPALLEHFRYDTTMIWNSEWESLGRKFLDFKKGGWYGLSYLAFLLVSWGVLLFSWPETKEKWPDVYRDWWVSLPLGLVLTWMSVDRVRNIPYALMFFLPLFVIFLVSLFEKKCRLLFALMALAITSATAWTGWSSFHRLGLSRDEVIFPDSLFALIEKNGVKGPLFSSFAVANYQLLRLPQFPVFVDPRDVIFNSVKPDYKNAFSHPDGMKQLLEKYKINSVFIETPKLARNSQGQLINALPYFFPVEKWALVAFSDQKALIVRRIEEHEKLIQKFEYKLLMPGLPPSASLEGADKDLDKRRRLHQEVERCLELTEKQVFCQVVMAGLESLGGSPQEKLRGLEMAQERLESVRQYSEQRSSVDHQALLQMLVAVYSELGMFEAADEAREQLTESPQSGS